MTYEKRWDEKRWAGIRWEELRWDEVWSVKGAVWSVGREECSVKCGVWSVKCGLWSVECEVWSVDCEVWSVECEVWSVDCEVWSVECEVWSVQWEACSVKCEVCSVKCGVWSVKCGVCSVKSAVCSVECEDCQVWSVTWSFKCDMWNRTSLSQSARTHGLGWRTAHASSVDEKGLIYIFKATSAPPRAGTTGISTVSLMKLWNPWKIPYWIQMVDGDSSENFSHQPIPWNVKKILVGGDWNMNILFSLIYWECHHPNLMFIYFSEGWLAKNHQLVESHAGVSENSVPHCTQWFCWSLSLWKMAISLGILTQHVQTNPYYIVTLW